LDVAGAIRADNIVDSGNNYGIGNQFVGRQASGGDMRHGYVSPSLTFNSSTRMLTVNNTHSLTTSSGSIVIPTEEPEQHVARTVTNAYTLPTTDTSYDLLAFNSVTFEEGDVDVNTSSERITVSSSGKYLITIKGTVFNNSGINNKVYVRFKKNGSGQSEYEALVKMSVDGGYPLNYSDIITLNSGQYLQLEARRGSASKEAQIGALYVTVSKI
jgi:hypothetical protein